MQFVYLIEMNKTGKKKNDCQCRPLFSAQSHPCCCKLILFYLQLCILISSCMKQQEKDILTVSYKYLLLPFLAPLKLHVNLFIVKNFIIVNFYFALMWCFLSFQMLIWCLDSSVRFADVLYPPN